MQNNINDAQKAYLRGLQYENEKAKITNPYGVKGKDGGTILHQLKDNKESQFQSVKTAERIGQQHQVNERTVREDGKFATAVNKIADTIGNRKLLPFGILELSSVGDICPRFKFLIMD